jgi:cytochrome b
VLAACWSAHADGDLALRIHFLGGYAVLALVVFRVLWGFAGPPAARFAGFVRGPAATLRYARALLGRAPGSLAATVGHNPLGAWSVLGLLGICLVLGASGLFTADEIASEGPLARLVSDAWVRTAGRVHANGEIALYVLVGMHVGAIAGYWIGWGRDLLTPMIAGRSGNRVGGRALVLLLLAGGLVAYLAGLAG